MQQLLHPLCLVLAMAGFLALLGPSRSPRRDQALTALLGVYALCALSFLVSLAPVWHLQAVLTGIPSIGILSAFGCVTAQVTLQLVVLAIWVVPPERAGRAVRRCLAGGAAVLAALVALFLRLPRSGWCSPEAFTAEHLHSSVYQAYLTLYIGTYTLGQGVLAAVCWRRAGGTGEAWIARGLRVVGAGALLTVGYSVVRLMDVGVAAFRFPAPPARAEAFAWLFADGGNMLVLIGFLLPMLALHTVPEARSWVGAYRDHQRLAPLWRHVHEALPSIALHPRRTGPAARRPVWAADWHLYRRAVEIRDGQWALRHHLDDSVRRAAERRFTAAGLRGAELAAAVTAHQLSGALTAHRRHETPAHPTEYADAVIRDTIRTPDDDVRALLRIAAHLARLEADPAPGVGADD